MSDGRAKTTWTAAHAALNGLANVTLVSAPAAGETRRVTRVLGQNNTAGARVLGLYLNDGSSAIPVWESRSVGVGECWNQTAAGYLQEPVEIVLSETTHTLEMDMTGLGTDRVVAIYETSAK